LGVLRSHKRVSMPFTHAKSSAKLTLWQAWHGLLLRPHAGFVLCHIALQAGELPRNRQALPLKGIMRRRHLSHHLCNGRLRLLIGLLQLPQMRHAALNLRLEVLQQLALVTVRPPVEQLCAHERVHRERQTIANERRTAFGGVLS
jgi:hypothetical protein